MIIYTLYVSACIIYINAAQSSISCSPQRIVTGAPTVLDCIYIGEKPTRIFFYKLNNSTGASLTLRDSNNASCHPSDRPNCTICVSPGVIGTSYTVSFNVSMTLSPSMFGMYRISVSLRDNRTFVYDVEARRNLRCVSSSTCGSPSVMRCTLPITSMNVTIEPHWEWVDDYTEHSVANTYATKVSDVGNHTEYSVYLNDLKERRVYVCELRYACDWSRTSEDRSDGVPRYCVLASSHISVQRPKCAMSVTVGPEWAFIILLPVIIVICCYIYRWLHFKCVKAARARI